ncbi:MAG: MFS transporter [Phototrophicaceae bacterium]
MKTKNRLPLYALYGTSLVSATGDVMAAVAVPWFVLQTTGSAALMGVAAFFSVLPIIIAMLFGGTLVDRIGYKQVSVFADFASGVTILIIPILHLTIGIQFWQLVLLVFLGNLLDAPGRSARQAMIPELAEVAEVSLERATGLANAFSRATSMLGAPLAGILIAFTSAPIVLMINAATFLVSAMGVQLFISRQIFQKQAEAQAESANSYWQDFREGFGFLQQDKFLLTLVAVVMVTNMIDHAISAVTMPYYVNEVYGNAWSLGLIMGSFGAAAVTGTLLYSWFGDKISRRWVFIIGYIIIGLRSVFMILYPPLAGMIVIAVVAGLAAGPINPIMGVLWYERIPDHMRARVFSLTSAGFLVAMPIGALLAGYLLEWVGLTNSLIIYGVIYFLATGSLIFNPTAKELEREVVIAEDIERL